MFLFSKSAPVRSRPSACVTWRRLPPSPAGARPTSRAGTQRQPCCKVLFMECGISLGLKHKTSTVLLSTKAFQRHICGWLSVKVLWTSLNISLEGIWQASGRKHTLYFQLQVLLPSLSSCLKPRDSNRWGINIGEY